MRIEWKRFVEKMDHLRQDWIDGQLKLYLHTSIHYVVSLHFFFSWNKIDDAKLSGQEIATRCEQETSNLSISYPYWEKNDKTYPRVKYLENYIKNQLNLWWEDPN